MTEQNSTTAAPNRAAAPFYAPVGNEVEVFLAARRRGFPVMLKGPTGCGKTRLVEHVAGIAGVPLYTVSCHEDMTASDLIGRFVLTGGSTEWIDGPLTRAVREGGICYLDEIVEARQDATVVIHSLTDHRRELNLERRGGERITAADGFQLVVSYNPGYQSVLKDLKSSTRQRMVAIDMDFPPPEVEIEIVRHEADVDPPVADALVRLGTAIRRVSDAGLREVASTRTLITAAALIAEGLSFHDAAMASITGPLTDDRAMSTGLAGIIEAHDAAQWPAES
ncbi:CbbQ/NirQ/NorQ/GpvN family protein [Mycolicibacterium sp.]|uniref:CbbQ/NirQ/NorQ/GpvN family protein n=1 Tax=Mycolicibacterium sp. TaxID=2320850 RepID=UPI001A28D195|nr:CbbQ/NirQ/NorQ/GpvN family protein [Mycolicibacterium sp.]MBJ7336809.1 CbbQ/NirQ/NorQ/GpvN family protein [Mycolicibacterium sp.]